MFSLDTVVLFAAAADDNIKDYTIASLSYTFQDPDPALDLKIQDQDNDQDFESRVSEWVNKNCARFSLQEICILSINFRNFWHM